MKTLEHAATACYTVAGRPNVFMLVTVHGICPVHGVVPVSGVCLAVCLSANFKLLRSSNLANGSCIAGFTTSAKNFP